MRLSATAAAIVATIIAVPAHADSFTYEGTIGKIAVVVEFAEAFETADTDIFGRYFYPRQGIDIPLRGAERTNGGLALHEELSCKEHVCEAVDGVVESPPLGARWDLATPDEGATITGTWAQGGRELPVTLKRVGQFPFEVSALPIPEDLATMSGIALWVASDDGSEPSPYERLKMESVALEQGPLVDWAGSSYRNVTDPRTSFAFPRIVALADGSSPDAANRTLTLRHWAMNSDAFGCLARVYAGMGWTEWFDWAAGSLGGWDDETIAVTYLSPTVMSWTESGSIFCGGAHPYNHSISRTIDVRTGGQLHMAQIFRGWVARDWNGEPVDFETALTRPDEVTWGPDDELVAFVSAHRVPSGDAEFEQECGIDQLIPEYLGIAFAADEQVRFGLDGLPHAINACGDDLLVLPLADVAHLLTPEAVRWFPSLAR